MPFRLFFAPIACATIVFVLHYCIMTFLQEGIVLFVARVACTITVMSLVPNIICRWFHLAADEAHEKNIKKLAEQPVWLASLSAAACAGEEGLLDPMGDMFTFYTLMSLLFVVVIPYAVLIYRWRQLNVQ